MFSYACNLCSNSDSRYADSQSDGGNHSCGEDATATVATKQLVKCQKDCKDELDVLSSDISRLTTAELKANKSQFNRFRGQWELWQTI